MNEILTKWVAALRSGEYKQATGTLCQLDAEGKPEGYCCLGVLEHVLDGEVEYYANDADEHIPLGMPSNNFLKKHGLAFDNLFGQSMYTLSEMNDSGSTFEEIANLLEGK